MKKTPGGNWALMKTSLAATFFWGLAAHGFFYFNAAFSHDSLLIYQNDDLMKTTMGRFLTPLYRSIRSPYTAPWLIGLFSLLWLSAAVYFLARMFGIKKPVYIAGMAGILAANYSLSLTNATYIHDADCYMLAVLFCVLGAFVTTGYSFGFLGGGFLIACSLALYQAELPIVPVLFILFLLKMILEDKKGKEILLFCVKGMLAMGSAFLFYKLGTWWFLTRKGIMLADSYNGIKGAGDFSEINIGALLVKTIRYVWNFFSGVTAYNLPRVRNASLCIWGLLIGLTVFLLVLKKTAIWKKILGGAAMLSMPLAINCVYFISKGMEEYHHLMVYPLAMVYVALIILLHYLDLQNKEKVNRLYFAGGKGIKIISALCLGVVLLNDVTFANDMYLKKELESRTTFSVMTRLIDRMENVQEYVPGETEVVLAGELLNSSLGPQREGFYEFGNFTGNAVPLAVTYYNTYAWYFEYVMGCPIKLSEMDIRLQYMDYETVKEMPVFPATGSVQMLDGRLVVKLGRLGG